MRYRTQRLEIRPFVERDREKMTDLFLDPTVKKTYMLPDFASREEAGKLFQRLLDLSQKEDRYVAAICLDGVCIGILNETEISGESIELGYALLSRHHNKGYCTEALAGAIQWLQDRGFREVVTGAFEENLASIRVMEKCAMERLDKTDEIEYRGKVHRCVYYAKRKSRRIFDTLVEKELIDKGWSGDKKYRAVSDQGKVYLLRIAPKERLERKRLEFERMQTVAELGIPMCLPVEFGECADGVYAIQSWIEGEDGKKLFPKWTGKRSMPTDWMRAGSWQKSIPCPHRLMNRTGRIGSIPKSTGKSQCMKNVPSNTMWTNQCCAIWQKIGSCWRTAPRATSTAITMWAT